MIGGNRGSAWTAPAIPSSDRLWLDSAGQHPAILAHPKTRGSSPRIENSHHRHARCVGWIGAGHHLDRESGSNVELLKRAMSRPDNPRTELQARNLTLTRARWQT